VRESVSRFSRSPGVLLPAALIAALWSVVPSCSSSDNVTIPLNTSATIVQGQTTLPAAPASSSGTLGVAPSSSASITTPLVQQPMSLSIKDTQGYTYEVSVTDPSIAIDTTAGPPGTEQIYAKGVLTLTNTTPGKRAPIIDPVIGILFPACRPNCPITFTQTLDQRLREQDPSGTLAPDESVSFDVTNSAADLVLVRLFVNNNADVATGAYFVIISAKDTGLFQAVFNRDGSVNDTLSRSFTHHL
jgi:hypothetical protein